MKILENCIYFHCNYTRLFPYYFEMNVHLLSSQTSFVHPRLLRRVDFSEATVLAVYLDQDGVHGQNFKQHLLGHLLKKTFLEEISPDLFQAKSHSSSPPSEIALQYVSGFMFTSTLEQETIVLFVEFLLIASTHGFFSSASGWNIPIHLPNFSFAFS